MRRRLLVCVSFGTLGLLAAVPVSDHLGIDLVWASCGTGTAGLVVGYVVSIMCDVFFGNLGETTEAENQPQ